VLTNWETGAHELGDGQAWRLTVSLMVVWKSATTGTVFQGASWSFS
jgi:hypothetical protein